MTRTQRGRQLQLASEVEDQARSLARSTREVPAPADVHALLGELRATLDHLSQTCAQLSRWHETASEHPAFAGEEPGAEGHAVKTVAAQLYETAEGIEVAERALGKAHTAAGMICWKQPS